MSTPYSPDRPAGSAFARGAAWAAVVAGCAVLAGWAANLDPLKSLLPGGLAMKANAALCFVFSGLALYFVQKPGKQAQRLAQACAGAAGGIALLTLVEYAGGWNFGIDEMLCRDSSKIATSHPGRMSPNAALAFVLVALALGLLGRWAEKARLPRIVGWLGFAVVVVGLFAALGYVVGFRFGYGWGSSSAMAGSTAALLMVLGAAVVGLGAREANWRWFIGWRLTLAFAGGLGLLVVVAAYSNRSARALVTAAARVKHSQEVIVKIHELEGDLEENQNGERGFVITGDKVFRGITAKVIPETHRTLRDLGALTADNPAQQERIALLGKAIIGQMDFSREIVELRETAGFDAAARQIAAGRGLALNEQARGLLRDMEAEESRLLAKRQAESGEITEATLTVLPAGALLSLLVIALGVLRLNGEGGARQRAANALAQSQQRLRLVLEAAQIGEWELDLVTHAARRSLKHDQIFGYTELVPEWSYEIFLEHVHLEDRARVDQNFQESVAAGRDWAFECRIVRRGGTPGWIWARGGVMKDEAGGAVMLGMVGDITEEKQAEEALRESEERVRLATEAAEIGIWAWDLKTNALQWDARLFAIYGLPPAPDGRAVYADWQARVLPEDLAEEEALLQTTLATCGRSQRTFQIKRANDGAVRFILGAQMVVAGADGKATRMVGINRDITEQKRAEVALRESEERVRLATESAGIGVWGWDVKTNELQWDRRMFEMYGLPEAPEGRAVYEDWQVRVLPEDLAEQEARLQHTVATCGRSQREFRITRASDGAVRFISAAEMVVVGADGKAARVVGINRDITQRKRAEEQISTLNANLQNRAAELEAANNELEGFSYSVSHDLRAPLRAVDGYSRMLLEDYAEKLDDDGRRKLDVIRSESQRMGRLIDDLLAFSRLGRQQVEPARIDMQAMAQEVFDELAALEPERNLRLDLRPLPPARGTPAMIRQVWVNLISNAIKFTKGREPGEIGIGVQEDGKGERIYFVKDNGAGFEMRHANKLFGVFQRLHAQQEFSGTGVGLALVQRIVQRHGGRVWAEAEVGRGATFYFTIPQQKI